MTIVKPIPDGFHTVTPYFVVQGAFNLVDFMKQAFDAEEIHLSKWPDGGLMHAQLRIGDSFVMVGEVGPGFNPMPSMIVLYVTDTDSVYRRTLEAGATSLMEPADQFYGDRNAGVVDPCGNHWWIATHKEDVSPEEMQKRIETKFKQP
jgi:uncharacterized glyoxalase superfamily protein PhnB